jgi:formylglycine-generating enzyme required for sulfatase activity
MNCVDWYQANRFCAWTFKRLPTEEEWEFAARGPEGRIYPWGNDAATADRANICGEECEDEIKPRHIVNWIGKREWNDSFVTTSPVAAQPNGRTPDGLFGLEGNVSEWTAKPLCGYDDALCFVQAIAIRGGAWVSFDAADSWYRGGSVPVTRHAYVGFRCARAPLTDSPK